MEMLLVEYVQKSARVVGREGEGVESWWAIFFDGLTKQSPVLGWKN